MEKVYVRHIKKNELEPSIWDGGKTFEYYIYPPESNYKNKDFLFRISTATIEKSPSIFTQFDNFQRYLIMLDNDLTIIRNNIRENYQQYEVFRFDSDDYIESWSVGNDFNLMIANNQVTATVCFVSDKIVLKKKFSFFFSLDKTVLKINGELYHLSKHDLVIIENLTETTMEVICDIETLFAEISC